jgi:hypothetical protein
VIDAEVEVEVESNDIFASSDLGCLGLGAMVPGTLVAADVVAGENLRGERGLEAVVVLANVLVGACLDAVEHQMREEEVSRGELGQHGECAVDKREMHGEMLALRKGFRGAEFDDDVVYKLGQSRPFKLYTRSTSRWQAPRHLQSLILGSLLRL